MQFKIYLCAIVMLLMHVGVLGQSGKRVASSYLNEEQPGLTPKIFAPGVVSLNNRFEFGSTFSASGKEFYYAVNVKEKPEIHFIKFENNTWTKPEILIVHEKYGYNDPFLSPDGKKLFFISDRALDGKSDKKDIDIWYVERTKNGWSDPINAGKEINTAKNEYYISFTKPGTLFFSSNGGTSKDNDQNYDIKFSELTNGKFQQAKKLGEAINTDHYEADVFIAPDEKYIIYCSERPGGKGKGDLYISFRDEKGEWQPAKNMESSINTADYEFCPFVTHDNKFFFFSRSGDIYWVSAEIINTLR